GRAQGVNIIVEGNEFCVVARQTILQEVERDAERGGRLIKGAAGNVEEAARARVERRVGTCERGGTDARELRAAAEVEVEAARSVGDLDLAAVSLARLR